MTAVLSCKTLPHFEGLSLPRYETAGAAGLDLAAALPVDAPLQLHPLQRALIPTGLMIAIPAGFEGQIRARSGLALKQGLALVNAPGTIDSDYRGEVGVLLINLGQDPILIERGMRIAQLVISPIVQCRIEQAETLDDSARGTGGFGSTGLQTSKETPR
jgi:dUTP pyrophosphatase